jgi:hypothetical protein
VVTDAVPETADGNGAGSKDTSAGHGGSFAVLDGEVPLQLPDGVGLAVIAGLADDVRITSAGPGTSVTMSWKRRAG